MHYYIRIKSAAFGEFPDCKRFPLLNKNEFLFDPILLLSFIK